MLMCFLGIFGFFKIFEAPIQAVQQQEKQWDAFLTERSRLSKGTASSASSCTEESALTVTEPLLTATQKT